MKALKTALLTLALLFSFLGMELNAASAPGTQAGFISFQNINSTGAKMNWVNGNGAGRIVVVSTANDFTNPSDGTTYTVAPADIGKYADPNPTLGTGRVIYNGTGSRNSIDVTGLAGNSTYWFRVYEYNQGGTPSPAYNTATRTMNPRQMKTAPAAPTNLTVVAGEITSYSALITWTKSDGVTYRLDLSKDALFGTFVDPYDDLDIGDADEWVFTNLDPNTQYYIRLRAVANGLSSDNATANFTTLATTPPVFAIQYFADAALTQPLGNNPYLKVGTYYLELTADQPLQLAPAIRIDANGNGSFDDPCDIKPEQGSVAYSDLVFVYTRTVTKHALLTGASLENYIIYATSLSGIPTNTAIINAAITNHGTGAAFIDTQEPTVVNVTSTDGDYKAGDNITIKVEFSEIVIVTGSPRLKLEVGGADRYATFVDGGGTTTLNFLYSVQTGDINADLDYTGTDALELNGGTINDRAGNEATRTLPAPGTAGSLSANNDVNVDGTAPTITNVTASAPAADGTYGAATDIDIQVTFSKNVTITGTPKLNLSILPASKDAVYDSYDAGTFTATFKYTVAVGDHTGGGKLDYTGTDALELPSGVTIKDAFGNDLDKTLPLPGATGSLSDNRNIVIDAVQPEIINITSDKDNGTYGIDEEINIQLVFNKIVNVAGGTPTLNLNSGAAAAATYTGGTNSNTLTFKYTVLEGHSTNLLNVNSLNLNGATIKDGVGTDATLTLPAAPNRLQDNKNIIIDGVRKTIEKITSTNTAGSYGANSVITIHVEFNAPVTVIGSPVLDLTTAPARTAVYDAASSSGNNVVFKYTVQADDEEDNLDVAGITLVGASTIQDAVGNDVDLTLPVAPNRLQDDKSIDIDAVAPTVVKVSTTGKIYTIGDVIDITIEFSKEVDVNNTGGNPTLALNIGGVSKLAQYSIGTGTKELVFKYTVVAGDNEATLNYEDVNSLVLNGGTILDKVQNNPNAANPVLPALVDANALAASNASIDTQIPTVEDVTSTPTDWVYKAGDDIPITIVFSKAVDVVGVPRLRLDIVSTTGDPIPSQYATYHSGTGTTDIKFVYTTQPDFETRSGGLEYFLQSSLDLNGGTIKSKDINLNANLLLPFPGDEHSLSHNTSIFIDATRPTVIDVTSDNSGPYADGDEIVIKVVFSEPVTVAANNAALHLETGAPVSKFAICDGTGSGTETLSFKYTVQADDYTEHLDYFDKFSLAHTMPGEFIKDLAGNIAKLTLPEPGAEHSLFANAHIILVGNRPYVTEVSATNLDANYTTNDVLNITVKFNTAVDVTGTPRLKLQTNNGDKYATYVAGDGTTTLTFNYTIVDNDHTDDLNYTGTDALELNGGTIKRAGENVNAILTLPVLSSPNSLAGNKDIRIVTARPTVIVGDGVYDQAKDEISFPVQFSQIVEGFDNVNTDVTVTGNAFDGVTPDVEIENGADGSQYQVVVSNMNRNGTVNVKIPEDVANIPGFVTLKNIESNEKTFNYYGTAPTPTITHTYGPANTTNDTVIRFIVTFDMPVNDFDDQNNDDVVIILDSTAKVKSRTISVNGIGGTQYFVDVEVETNGTFGIQIPAGAAVSQVGGIGNTASAPSDLIEFTALAPIPTITHTYGLAASTTTLPIKFKVTFNEKVSDLDIAHLEFLTGAGTADPDINTATVDRISDTEFEVTINNVAQNGTVQIKVLAGQVQNDYGTVNVEAESPIVTYWGVAPTAEITYAGADPTTATTINFTVTFDQEVTDFQDNDITLGGTANPITKDVTGGPKVYDVAVSGMTAAGTVNITFPAGAAQNAGGKASLAPVLTKNEVDFNPADPEVTQFTRLSAVNEPIMEFQVVFNQAVKDFGDALNSFTLTHTNQTTGLSCEVFDGVDGDNTYKIRVNGITKNGNITVKINAGAAVSSNYNLPSAEYTGGPFAFTADAPEITIALADDQDPTTTTLPIKFKVTFNEDVSGFDVNGTGIEIGGTASAGATATVNKITDRVYEVVVTDITVNGTINIKVKVNSVQNSYGTNNLESAPSPNVTYWGIAPTATIARKAGQAAETDELPIEFTVTFSQPVTGFTADYITFGASTANPSDVTITPATIPGPSAVYTVSVGNVANNGTVIIAFAAGAAENGGGVGNLAPTYQPNEAGVEVTFNMPAPTCILALAGGQNSPTNELPIAYTATFSQTVTGFNTSGIEATLDGVPLDGGVTITPVGVDGKVYTIEVDGLTTSGELELTVLADAAENQYGEVNTASNTVACVYDITKPTATITLVSTDPTNVSPVNFRIVFSKPVFGFDENALTVIGPFPVGGAEVKVTAVLGQTTWDIEITGMNADGLISVSIEADKVTDLAENKNIAAGPVTCQYNLPPMPPAGPAANALSVRYFTRTTIAIGITQPTTPLPPTILIGKKADGGPLAPVLTGDISNYGAIASLAFNNLGTLADGSCVLYVGSSDQVTITGLARNTTYTFALYTYDQETGLYCLDADAALLTKTTQNRESILEQDIPGAIAGTNLALTPITPNPVVNNVNLTLDLFTDANITIEVIDGNGQVVAVPVSTSYYAEGTHTLSFAMQNIASGSYFLRVSTETEAVIQRFIYMP